MKSAVVYSISFFENTELMYIGSTINLKKRVETHKSTLKNNTHHNCTMQDVYNSLKDKRIKVDILERCNSENCKELEYKHIKLIGFDKLYNILDGVLFGDAITNHPNKKEIIKNISIAVNKRNANMTAEQKELIRLNSLGDKNPNWRNGGISKKKCKCGRTISYVNSTCFYCRDRTKDKNPFFGKKHSEEFIKMISERNKGRIPTNSRPVLINGIKYNSATNAAKEIGCAVATIFNRINAGKEGYFFVNA